MAYLSQFFSNAGFMPHIHCYLGKPSLVWTMVVTDTLIGLAYVGISLTLWALIRKIKIPFNAVVFCFGIFIAACGLTHFMEVYTLWTPVYWASAGVKAVTAIASVGTGIYLYQLRLPITQMAEAAKLSEQRRLDLQTLAKSLEERVAQRTTELERAVSIRDEFFSVASHELRTPLTSLKMKIQIAKRGQGAGAEPGQEKKFLSEMEEQVDRLVKLVEDMLDISRFRSGQLQISPAEHDLGEVVRTTVERFAAQFQSRGIETKLQIPTQPLVLTFDRLRLEQVLANLLSNAMKYAPQSPLSVSVSCEGENAKVTVKDKGPGIARADQARIFEKFERLVSATNVSGLGVGLYLSRSIAEAHGGRLQIESAPGEGAEFSLYLPLQPKGLEGTLQLGKN